MIVVSYGGGTNSTALLVEAYRRGVRPDVIVFSDTGSEMPHTYQHIRVVQEWLRRIGFPELTIVWWQRQDGTFRTIEQVSLLKGELPSKAYGMSGCTTKWKQQPIDKFVCEHPEVRAAWARGEAVERWIGYDADEPERAERMLAKIRSRLAPVRALLYGGRHCWSGTWGAKSVWSRLPQRGFRQRAKARASSARA